MKHCDNYFPSNIGFHDLCVCFRSTDLTFSLWRLNRSTFLQTPNPLDGAQTPQTWASWFHWLRQDRTADSMCWKLRMIHTDGFTFGATQGEREEPNLRVNINIRNVLVFAYDWHVRYNIDW